MFSKNEPECDNRDFPFIEWPLRNFFNSISTTFKGARYHNMMLNPAWFVMLRKSLSPAFFRRGDEKMSNRFSGRSRDWGHTRTIYLLITRVTWVLYLKVKIYIYMINGVRVTAYCNRERISTQTQYMSSHVERTVLWYIIRCYPNNNNDDNLIKT